MMVELSLKSSSNSGLIHPLENRNIGVNSFGIEVSDKFEVFEGCIHTTQ